MKHERFEPRGRGALALAPSAFGALFAVVEEAPSAETRGEVVVVSVQGPLMHHGDWCFDSYDAIKARVLSVLEMRPKAIVLAVDSPGGLVSGCFDTAKEIRAACDAAGVEVHSYVDGLSASAGYALACIGKTITIPEAGIAGSIGVIETMVDESAALAANGIAIELVASGARKTDGNPAMAITDGARAAVRARVEELAAVFASHVATYRPLSVDAVRGQEAALFAGASAVRAGLADRVGSLDDLVAILAAGSAAPLAQDGGTMSEEEKARAALKAIVDDEKSDEKAKSRAKAALAAMEEEEPDGDEKDGEKAEHKEPDGDEASASTPGASLAHTSASLEARLRILEAERESDRKAAILKDRPDIGAETRAALAKLPLGQMKAIVATMPRRDVKPAASAVVPVTRGESEKGGDAIGAVAHDPAIDLAMGRARVTSTGVSVSADGRTITLGADVVTPPKKGV
jgi:ClpP class serine protease